MRSQYFCLGNPLIDIRGCSLITFPNRNRSKDLQKRNQLEAKYLFEYLYNFLMSIFYVVSKMVLKNGVKSRIRSTEKVLVTRSFFAFLMNSFLLLVFFPFVYGMKFATFNH